MKLLQSQSSVYPLVQFPSSFIHTFKSYHWAWRYQSGSPAQQSLQAGIRALSQQWQYMEMRALLENLELKSLILALHLGQLLGEHVCEIQYVWIQKFLREVFSSGLMLTTITLFNFYLYFFWPCVIHADVSCSPGPPFNWLETYIPCVQTTCSSPDPTRKERKTLPIFLSCLNWNRGSKKIFFK